MPREKTADRGLLPPGTKSDLYVETGGRCAHCGARIAYKSATIDHIIPISKGGADSRENLAILCGDCNSRKYNHVIDPAGYYRFLPKDRLAQVSRMFQDYLDSTEWLAWENLFRVDQFECRTACAIFVPKSRKIFMAPATVQVRKMLPAEAYDWLQLYRAHIRPADRCLVIEDPRDIEHPFYEISRNGKPIAVFECYMGVDDGLVSPEHLPCVMMNLFSHWDLEYRQFASEHTMLNIVWAVMSEIQDTLTRSAPRSLTAMAFKSVSSDRHVSAMLKVVPRKCMHPFAQTDFGKLDPDAKVIGFTTILFQGGSDDIRDLMEEAGVQKASQLYETADRAAMAKPIMDRLEEQPDDLKPDRMLYKDMNGSYTARKGRNKRKKK